MNFHKGKKKDGRDKRWETVYAHVGQSMYEDYIEYMITLDASCGRPLTARYMHHKDDTPDVPFAFVLSILVREVDNALDYHDLEHRMAAWPLN